jgi:DNA segregation ATPase FtsK/SpoIIIE-like protein
VPHKNKAGDKPLQGPGPLPSTEQWEPIRKTFEAAQRDIERAIGLSPEELRRVEEFIRRQQEFLEAAFPPSMRQLFEALEREHCAKEAEAAERAARQEIEQREAAEQEAARQAWRARRKGVGGRRKAMTPTEIEAARERLRRAIEENPNKRRFDLAHKDFINWWGEDPERAKRKVPSPSLYREKVFRPEVGSKRVD